MKTLLPTVHGRSGDRHWLGPHFLPVNVSLLIPEILALAFISEGLDYLPQYQEGELTAF